MSRAEIVAFLDALEQPIERLLRLYRVPPDARAVLLDETFEELRQRWPELDDRKKFLFDTLRRNCLVWWRKRRRKLYAAVDSAFWFLSPPGPPA